MKKVKRQAQINISRNPRTGRFLSGNNGGGRPIGSRNKLASDFIAALHDDFQENGPGAIERVARDEPAQYLRVIAQILPKELDIALNSNPDLCAEVQDFAAAYRLARSYIGATEQPPLILDAQPKSGTSDV